MAITPMTTPLANQTPVSDTHPKKRGVLMSLLAAGISIVAFVILQIILAGSQAELGILYVFIFAPFFFLIGFLLNVIVQAIIRRIHREVTQRNLLLWLLAFDAFSIIVFMVSTWLYSAQHPV